MKKTVLTGDRPTGRLHLGHYVGSIQNRIKLQDEADKAFYMIADVQALTDNAENPEKVRSNVLEVALDNLACGLDPEKTTFFIQSQVPQIAELTVFFLNLVTVARLEQNPTVKAEMLQKGFAMNASDAESIKGVVNEKVRNVPAGFLAYPVSQSADILFCKGNLVPVGEDQKPVLEQCNEIVDTFNRLYGDTFDRVQHLVGDTARLIGTDGNAKMSKSLNNGIYLSDSKETIAQKVQSMYTDPNHIRVEDPGQVEGNVVFTYLDIFDEDKATVAELKEQYQKGGLGDVVLKKRLVEVLENLIAPIRTRREELAKNPDAIMHILKKGTEEACRVGEQTMSEVRKALHINYF
jgi:tryptophanyl-tRNA synthetase